MIMVTWLNHRGSQYAANGELAYYTLFCVKLAENEEGFLQEGMVNNSDVPVDPENEAYEMPPEALLKHSDYVASCEGTGGTKLANGSPVCTKNTVKNESIRAATSAGVNC
ncbi:hypothetical protein BTVI_30699 [Pitangus sulphuratus]|nr:hypothetical protein BTVI_30699 [Pitangus sulphuratus]